ncbi:MAG TPA: GtrA family protein [Anaerolineales bacterium]|nr:GtrA family protein [Anaerolineales bacterium]
MKSSDTVSQRHDVKAGAGSGRQIASLESGLSLIGFLAVGASGIVVNTLLLAVLAESADLHYLLAAALATQGSTLWNFALHHAFVFRGRAPRRPLLGRIARYLLVNNAALLIRGPMLAALVSWLGIHYLTANLLTIISLTLLRFLLADRWIWPREEPGLEAPLRHAYDIHGILSVDSIVALPELAHFRVPTLDRKADIEVHLGPPPGEMDFAHGVHYHDGFGPFGFRLWLKRAGSFKVWVSPLVALSPHVLYTNVVEPILRWSFVERGYALVHAASIAFDGRAAMITAPTDTGKTTTILRALQSQSWTFLSDDMSILSPDGVVRSFAKPLTISAHTLHAVPTARLDFSERIALAIQSRLHSRDGRRFGLRLAELGLPAATINSVVQFLIPPPKYSVSRLIPEVRLSREASLSLVVVLAKGPDRQERLSPAALLRTLQENAEDAYGFPPYRSLEGFLSRDGDLDYHWAEREIVRQALHQASGIRLSSEKYRWWKSLPSLFRAHEPVAAEAMATPRALASEPQNPA